MHVFCVVFKSQVIIGDWLWNSIIDKIITVAVWTIHNFFHDYKKITDLLFYGTRQKIFKGNCCLWPFSFGLTCHHCIISGFFLSLLNLTFFFCVFALVFMYFFFCVFALIFSCSFSLTCLDFPSIYSVLLGGHSRSLLNHRIPGMAVKTRDSRESSPKTSKFHQNYKDKTKNIHL